MTKTGAQSGITNLATRGHRGQYGQPLCMASSLSKMASRNKLGLVQDLVLLAAAVCSFSLFGRAYF